MTDSEEESLKDLFTWANRDIVLRVLFEYGDELEMTVSGWAQDVDEAPHCHGTVVRTLTSKHLWNEGSAIMFQLHDVQQVIDVNSNKVVFHRLAND